MTFKQGFSTSNLDRNIIKCVTTYHGFDVGIEEVEIDGLRVRVYNIERTIIDLLKPKYDADKEQLIPVLKKYSKYKQKSLSKLYTYAKLFGVEKKLQSYMEVLI